MDEIENKVTSKKLSLDNFILQSFIGCGSFGKVYKVKLKETGELLAAKISMHEIKSIHCSLIRDILREVDIISKLNHPSVLKFIYFSPINFKHKSKPVIITEYASNGSLDILLDQNRNLPSKVNLNNTRKLIIIYGIASAMSYMHFHNIIHRDLKPGNILLDNFLFPKIADFGFSKINRSNESAPQLNSAIGSLKGTPIYMSPEIWTKAIYSKASDVYAFALIVYEIITNQKPFHNFNYFQILASIQQGNRPEFDHPIPYSYRNLIENCWAQEPSLRPSFDDILIKLKNDKGFINESVNEEEFMSYANFIDNYKTTFISNSQIDFFKNKFINHQISIFNNRIIENAYSSSEFIPYKILNKMEKTCIDLIINAENDQEKQFLIGKSLIEGCNDFQQSTQLGLNYLKKLINENHIKSLIYYCNMLIKGSFIPQNLKKAKKLIQSKLKCQSEKDFLLLTGKIFKKEKEYSKAQNCFEKSMKLDNGESTYQYGKMFLIEPNSTQNENEFIQYLIKAINKGHPKSMYKYGLILLKKENKEEGIKYIKMAADKGYTKAMYYYSILIENEDKELYLKYLTMAKNQGYTEAIYKYAIELGNSNEHSHILLKKACDKGHMNSMYLYGMALLNGDGIPTNKEEAAKYLKIAADNGIEDAIAEYGDILVKGEGIPIDIENGIKYYKIGIEKGNSQSMASFGYLLSNVEGEYKNIEEAIKYYKMAIDKGNSEAMNNLAYLLENEDYDSEKNIEESAKYYRMAIDQGSSIAMSNYASMLNKYKYISKNKEEAIKYYKMAIDQGNSAAMNNYAYILDKGIGVEVNKEEAIKYYKMAIDKGCPSAMNNYAHLLDTGDGVEVNKQEAIKYYKMAINRGNSSAMNNYAYILDKGVGIEANKEEATKYYKLAIENGNSSAMDNYGQILRNDNKEEAIKYFKMAIEKGNPNAMNNYGLALFNGDGIEVNKEEANKYFKMAIDKGNSDAMVNYGYSLSIGERTSINKEEAVKYYKMATDKGNYVAMFRLAFAYLSGDGVEQNIDEGLRYLKMSADNGFSDGINAYKYFLSKIQNT